MKQQQQQQQKELDLIKEMLVLKTGISETNDKIIELQRKIIFNKDKIIEIDNKAINSLKERNFQLKCVLIGLIMISVIVIAEIINHCG
jgi:hypothetical protein